MKDKNKFNMVQLNLQHDAWVIIVDYLTRQVKPVSTDPVALSIAMLVNEYNKKTRKYNKGIS